MYISTVYKRHIRYTWLRVTRGTVMLCCLWCTQCCTHPAVELWIELHRARAAAAPTLGKYEPLAVDLTQSRSPAWPWQHHQAGSGLEMKHPPRDPRCLHLHCRSAGDPETGQSGPWTHCVDVLLWTHWTVDTLDTVSCCRLCIVAKYLYRPPGNPQ